MKPLPPKKPTWFAFVLAMYFLAPAALADVTIEFDKIPEAEFRVYEGGSYVASVESSDLKQPTLVHMYVAGPLGTVDSKEYLVESYTYEKESTHDFSWNGLINNQYLKAGKYELRFKSGGLYQDQKTALTHKFDLTDPFKITTNNDEGGENDQDDDDSDGDDEEDSGIDLDVESTEPVCAELRVDGKLYKFYEKLEAGAHKIEVEALIKEAKLEPGAHKWELYVDTEKCGGSEEEERVIASGQFDVEGAENDYSQFCGKFTDIQPNDPDCPAIGYVYSIGAMTGYPDGTFRKEKILQRDESAKISLKAFKLFVDSTDYCKGKSPYPDITLTGLEADWSAQYVCRGTETGMITGYEGGEDKGKFIPERLVNMAEFLALILRNLEDPMPSRETASYPNIPSGHWFSGFFKYAQTNSLLDVTDVKPTDGVSRVQVAKTLYKLHLLGKL